MPNRHLRSIEELKLLISFDTLHQFFIEENHTRTETQDYFQIEDTELDYLIKEYQLAGKKAILYGHKANFNKLREKIPYDKLFEYFITQQHTINESAAHFGVPRTKFRRLLSEYGIKKSVTCAAETQKRFMLDTYGVKNSFQLETTKQKSKKTFLTRYGVEHALQKTEFLQKAIDTSIARHGENFRVLMTNNSRTNQAFAKMLSAIDCSFTQEKRIGTKFFDFQVGNILIDLNPTPTHNVDWSPFKQEGSKIDALYHVNKRNLGVQAGYSVISLFDWLDTNKIIKLFFGKKHILYARNCEIRHYYKQDFAKIGLKDFLEQNHLQGYPRYGQEVVVCLYYQDTLVAVQTWGTPRYANKSKYGYELYRQATKAGFQITGGNEKMFEYFQRIINIDKKNLVTYCDYNVFSGKTYSKLGFILKQIPKPTVHWVYLGNKVSGMTENQKHFTDNLVRQNGFDRLLGSLFGTFGKGTSNEQLLLDHDYVRVYDCGQATYIWINN